MKVRPVMLLLSVVRPRKRLTPAFLTADCSVAPSAGMIGSGTESITSRATAPFWRASMKRPSTSIVRRTFGAAEMSISVTIVTLACGATSGATGRPTIVSADAPLVEIASTRSPRSSSRWSKPVERERPGDGRRRARSRAACRR